MRRRWVDNVWRVFSGVVLATFLASCAKVPTASTGRGAELQRLGYRAVPLTDARGSDSRLGVNVRVNGEAVNLLLDSGANTSHLSRKTAERSAVQVLDNADSVSRGALGQAQRLSLASGRLTLGEISAENFLFTVGARRGKKTALANFEGILGNDALRNSGALVDVKEMRVWLPGSPRILQSKVSLGRNPRIGQATLPLSVARGSEHYLLKGRINGSEVLFVVDTGAEISLLNFATAQRLGLTTYPTNVNILDAHGLKQKVGFAKIDRLQLAGVEVHGLEVGVGNFEAMGGFLTDRSGRKVDGILGINFLRESSALIDAKSRLIYFSAQP